MKAAGHIRVLALGLSLAGLSGCPRPVPPPDEPGARFESGEQLLAAVRERAASLQSLRGSGVVEMRRGAKRIKAHMLALARRPAWLRFETESVFDQPLSILVSDGLRFAAWDMQEGRFARGRATPAAIGRVLPVAMDGPEVVGILLGDAPLIPYASAALDWDPAAGAWRLRLSTSQLEQRLWIRPRGLVPLRVECDQQGAPLYRLEYEDWETHPGGVWLPGKIHLEVPAEEAKLQIKLRRVEINIPLADELFRLEPPEGLAVEEVE